MRSKRGVDRRGQHDQAGAHQPVRADIHACARGLQRGTTGLGLLAEDNDAPTVEPQFDGITRRPTGVHAAPGG
jgi:hypothetical protein